MKRVLVALMASALIFSGCGLKGGTIIKVNNKNITKSQFDEAYKNAAKNSQLAQMGIEIPENEDNLMYLMIKDRVVNELIVKELINQEMDRRQIKVTKEDTERERQRMIDKVGSKEKFNEILKQNGISNAKFEKDLAQEIKMKKLVDIIHPVSISDNQAKAFYDKNINQFKYPDKVRASHILISANPVEIKEELRKKNTPMSEIELNERVQQVMKERYDKAVEIRNQVKDHPESFEAIARDVSADTLSAKNGGDIGFFAKKDMVKPFADVAFSQKPNTISEVVQTPYGFHIIKVTDRMAAGQQPFVKVKEQIKMYLTAQEQIKALEIFLGNLKAHAVIQYVNSSYDPVQIETKMKKIAAERKAALNNQPKNVEVKQAAPAGN
ncbi:MAG: peptidylprolyl isomerase [Cyanobacteria bacterium RUI128]|nr:peptidylprolyl isomerase [Cyanobacteria bacterium RUI128]